jgi:hypothetical protein
LSGRRPKTGGSFLLKINAVEFCQFCQSREERKKINIKKEKELYSFSPRARGLCFSITAEELTKLPTA